MLQRITGTLAACLLASTLLLACAAPRAPGKRAAEAAERRAVEIHDLVTAGPYLEASVSGPRGQWRFFFPNSEACGVILEAGSAQYRRSGPFGQLRDGDGRRCAPIGVSDLVRWRDGERRRQSHEPASGAHALFQPLPESQAFLMARGRFPLSRELGWPEPMDSVVFLPLTDACRALMAVGDATMVFRTAGPEVFLLEPDGEQALPCPILGFALPLEEEK